MQRQEQVVGDTFVYRFCGENPKYALIISHGLGGHGGIYDQFCAYHAAQGVDIWSYDAPGHGRSTPNRPRGQWTMEEAVEAGVSLAEHVKETTGLPVFVLGSSMGAGAAFGALYSDAIEGAILMGSILVPSSPLLKMAGEPWRNEAVGQVIDQLGRGARLDISLYFNFDEDYGYLGAQAQKQLDPNNTWSYDLASWRSVLTFDPKVSVENNTKPILMAYGSEDPNFTPEFMKMTIDSLGGPVDDQRIEGAGHQLMMFETEKFSSLIQDFVNKSLSAA